jgi:hypothetical protein
MFLSGSAKMAIAAASVSSLKIDYVRYDGYLVPLRDQPNTPPQEVNPI